MLIVLILLSSSPPHIDCSASEIAVAKAGVALYRSPDNAAEAERLLESVPTAEILQRPLDCMSSNLYVGVSRLPIPESMLRSLAPPKEGTASALRQDLGRRAEFARPADDSICRDAEKFASDRSACTPYRAETLIWRGVAVHRLLAKNRSVIAGLDETDRQFWLHRTEIFKEWETTLSGARSRPLAIIAAMGRESLREWVLDEVFGNPDPRKWHVEEVAAAFVGARREDEREAAAQRSRRAELDRAGVIEQTTDASAGDRAPNTYAFLRRAMRMGLGNALRILRSRTFAPAGPASTPDVIDTTCRDWYHAWGECTLYRADWEAKPEAERPDLDAYGRERWLELDSAAPHPDLDAINLRIIEIEREASRSVEKK